MESRIKILLDYLGISASEFADSLKVPRSSVSHILSGRNNPSLEFLRKMLLTYPQISADWLLLGQGNISRDAKVVEGTTKPETTKENRKLHEPPVEKVIIFYADGTFREYNPAVSSD